MTALKVNLEKQFVVVRLGVHDDELGELFGDDRFCRDEADSQKAHHSAVVRPADHVHIRYGNGANFAPQQALDRHGRRYGVGVRVDCDQDSIFSGKDFVETP